MKLEIAISNQQDIYCKTPMKSQTRLDNYCLVEQKESKKNSTLQNTRRVKGVARFIEKLSMPPVSIN